MFQNLLSIITAPFKLIGNLLGAGWNTVQVPFRGLFSGIGGFLSGAPTGASWGALVGLVAGMIKGWQGSKEGKAVNPITSGIGGAFMGAIGGSVITGGINGAVSGGSAMVDQAGKAANNLAQIGSDLAPPATPSVPPAGGQQPGFNPYA